MRNRSLLLFLSALICVAALAQPLRAAPKEIQQQPATTEIEIKAIPHLLERIARAQEAEVALRETEKADDRPTRDLAAQEAMVSWAKLSFIATVVGILLSGGGLLAVLYSLRLNRRATDAAQAAVAVARQTNEAQSRPWLSVSCSLGKPNKARTHAGVDGIYFNVHCLAKNHGRSPATGVSFHAEIALCTPNGLSPNEMMNNFCDAIRNRSDHDAEAIFPDAEATHSHMVFLPIADIDADLKGKDFKMIAPVVYGCINFKSPYTKGVRQTRFVYHVATTNDEGQALVIRPDQAGWLDQSILFMSPGTIISD